MLQGCPVHSPFVTESISENTAKQMPQSGTVNPGSAPEVVPEVTDMMHLHGSQLFGTAEGLTTM
jgi:hypothetical protein